MTTKFSNKYGLTMDKAPINVFISLYAIMESFAGGIVSYTHRKEKIQFYYYADEDGILTQLKDAEKKLERYIYSQPPKPYAVDTIKQIVADKRFEVYFLFPMYRNTQQADFDMMRDWFLEHIGHGFKKRILLTHNYDITNGGIFIENNHTLFPYGFTGFHFKIGNEKCPDWQTVQLALFEPKPLLEKFRR